MRNDQSDAAKGGSMVKARYQTKAGAMEMGEDHIIRFRILPGATVDSETAKECVAGVAELAGPKRHILLIDMRNLRDITQGARRIYHDGPAFAVALLVASPVSKVIGSFFIGLNRPSYPLRIFTSETKAIEWLKDYIE